MWDENLVTDIGQEPYKYPSVFNFYFPDYQAPGILTDTGLVSPESQLATAPFMIGFMNGISSLMNFGLTSCGALGENGYGDGGGFGQFMPRTEYAYWGMARQCNIEDEILDTNDGNLMWIPQEYDNTLAELDLLLTGSRINPDNMAILQEHFDQIENVVEASHYAKLLIVGTAEFHTESSNALTSEPRPIPAPPQSQGRAYKAVVILYLGGGADTHNMLVPLSECSAEAGDLYAQYAEVRTSAAVATHRLLPISVPVGTQPCDTFGVHETLPVLKQLYDDGDLAFFAHIGEFIQPAFE